VKQRITIEQLNELSDAQKQRLRELWKPQDGDFIYSAKHGHPEFLEVAPMRGYGDYLKNRDKSLPLLNIGQMIEILSEILLDISIVPKSLLTDKKLWSITITFRETTFMKSFEKSELCDALWQATKEIL